MGVNSPALFYVAATITPLIQLALAIFAIYFLVNAVKFLKQKSEYNERKLELMNQFLELYKSSKDIQ